MQNLSEKSKKLLIAFILFLLILAFCSYQEEKQKLENASRAAKAKVVEQEPIKPKLFIQESGNQWLLANSDARFQASKYFLRSLIDENKIPSELAQQTETVGGLNIVASRLSNAITQNLAETPANASQSITDLATEVLASNSFKLANQEEKPVKSEPVAKTMTDPEKIAKIDSNQLTGKVISVSDGDTVTVLLADNKQEKIRLNQIDAPESKQDFGNASKKALSKLIYNKQVTVVPKERDKYGRLVGTIFIGDKDINLEQVKLGMAWVYTKYASDPAYFEAHEKAKSDTTGLWSQPDPIAPWEFRKGVRKQVKPKLEQASLSAESVGDFTCGPKRFCKQMDSCAEARFYLENCGVSRLDKDDDGIPCESLCN